MIIKNEMNLVQCIPEQENNLSTSHLILYVLFCFVLFLQNACDLCADVPALMLF